MDYLDTLTRNVPGPVGSGYRTSNVTPAASVETSGPREYVAVHRKKYMAQLDAWETKFRDDPSLLRSAAFARDADRIDATGDQFLQFRIVDLYDRYQPSGSKAAIPRSPAPSPAQQQALRKGVAPVPGAPAVKGGWFSSTATGGRVGDVVKVYERVYEGRPNQPYFLARVVSVAPNAIQVVAAHRKETLTRAEWDGRVRDNYRGFMDGFHIFPVIIPDSARHPQPPPLPPGIQADARTVVRGSMFTMAKIGVAMVPVAIGAAVGRWNPKIGTQRGALAGAAFSGSAWATAAATGANDLGVPMFGGLAGAVATGLVLRQKP